MKIQVSTFCKIGGREYNQDYLASSINEKASCFVVCDGLGSYYGSEVASQLCATHIINDFEKICAIDPNRAVQRTFVEAYIQNAHNNVVAHKQTNNEISTSCTTVALAVTNGNATTFAHIGDSRIYFFRNNKLEYQSKDHSLSQVAVDSGEITLQDIRTHKDQNKLTRVLGSDFISPADIETLNSGEIQSGDSFILCTDGFWEYVFEEEMEEDLSNSYSPSEALEKMEQRLLKRIGKYNDNYTAIVAMVVED
ncbi:MAG: protein phosphatase 2C domain-containing protein [Firmicutes bacterium]|nr:protein phosphatase 2C domain-containing protein [Bacillota bacterium]